MSKPGDAMDVHAKGDLALSESRKAAKGKARAINSTQTMKLMSHTQRMPHVPHLTRWGKISP